MSDPVPDELLQAMTEVLALDSPDRSAALAELPALRHLPFLDLLRQRTNA